MPSAVVIGKNMEKCRDQADRMMTSLSRRETGWRVDLRPSDSALDAFYDIALVNTDDGLEDAEGLRSRDRRVAIALACDTTKYAFAGYHLAVSAYLLPPNTPEQMDEAVAEGLRRLEQCGGWIDLPTREGMRRECLNAIEYIAREGGQARVYALDRSYLLTEPMDALCLPPHFFLCDSVKINLHHVRQITKQGLWVNGLYLPISAGARRRLVKAMPMVCL